ncbi:MAG: GNAT family N-acetyltransferase [Eubacteriales bacterium]|nr:GNAT family N-acetyltransferase [Eubacteriales bacterium]
MIKKLTQNEIREFLPLVWDVFCEYEAPNYPEDARQMFKNAIYDEKYLSMLSAYGAYEDNEPAGIIATREAGRHVALFFVAGKYHRQGIGRRLFEAMLKDNPKDELTVHSSLYAVPVYERLGFIRTGDVQSEDGITYLPMKYVRRSI